MSAPKRTSGLRLRLRELDADARAVGRGLAVRGVMRLQDQRRAGGQPHGGALLIHAHELAGREAADRAAPCAAAPADRWVRRLLLIRRQRRSAGLARRDRGVLREDEHRRAAAAAVSPMRRRRRRRRGAARRCARVHDDVMEHARIAGAHLHRLDPLVLGERGRDLEVLIRDGAVRREPDSPPAC